MKDKIKQAIKTTLVIDNKQSIDLCIDKIYDLYKPIIKEIEGRIKIVNDFDFKTAFGSGKTIYECLKEMPISETEFLQSILNILK